MRRRTTIFLSCAVAIAIGSVWFGWSGPAPDRLASARLSERRVGVTLEAAPRATLRFEDVVDLEDPEERDRQLDAYFERIYTEQLRIVADAKRGCRQDHACTAAVLHATAATTEDRLLAGQLRNAALETAEKADDEALWQDLLVARGTGRTERDLERRMAQGWGRFLAARAPGLQQKAVKAAVLVTPDSPLHEPLAWLGGYPACDVDRARGWVACAPQGR